MGCSGYTSDCNSNILFLKISVVSPATPAVLQFMASAMRALSCS